MSANRLQDGLRTMRSSLSLRRRRSRMRIAILITNGENIQSSNLTSTSRDSDSSAHDHKGPDLLKPGPARWGAQIGIVNNQRTITKGLICSSLAGPIPETESKSSSSMKGPFSCRNATILAAKLGPIPGRPSSSGAVAVLTFI